MCMTYSAVIADIPRDGKHGAPQAIFHGENMQVPLILRDKRCPKHPETLHADASDSDS